MKTITYHQDSKACQALKKSDPYLFNLINDVKEVKVNIDDDYFKSLLFTILSQQLSSKVASVIISRFLALFNHDLSPDKIVSSKDEDLRSIGCSYQKITYVKSLSQAIIDHVVTFKDIEEKSNEEVKEMLIKVKGIGPWSADMFLMFSLGREDVFSTLDLGLRNAVKSLYQNESLSHNDIESISLKWQPYRSIASHFLWHMHDRNK